MSQLKLIYQLLREEYAISRHIFWLENGHLVNDVTYTLRLVVSAAQGLRDQNQTAWQQLVTYAIHRAMNASLILAIAEYLQACGNFPPLPLIQLCNDEPQYSWRGGRVPLLDESDQVSISAMIEHPEPDRELTLKGACQWSYQQPRLRDKNPHHVHKNQTKATHWLL